MNITLKNSLLILLLVVGLIACENEDISSLDTQTVVVEAFIYAGQPIDSIRITQSNSYAQTDTNLITLNDLVVQVSDGDQSVELINIGNGYYQYADWPIETEKSYTIEFEHNGESISSTTYVPPQKEASISETEIEMEKIEGGFPGGGFTQLDPIEISWNNESGDYYYVVINNIEDNPEYINAIFEDPNAPIRQFSFISEPEVTDFHLINPRRELQQFGTHEIIVFRVNPEYAALYESSGTSTLSIAEPPTNITNGLGIFTGVSSDTVYLEVKKI